MITLALAQMVFFFYLQARFTGGEDGIQSVPRGTLFGILDLHDTMTLYFVVLRSSSRASCCSTAPSTRPSARC